MSYRKLQGLIIVKKEPDLSLVGVLAILLLRGLGKSSWLQKNRKQHLGVGVRLQGLGLKFGGLGKGFGF